MSNFKAFQLPLISLLLFTSIFTPNPSVFASPFVRNQTFTRPDPLRHFRLYKGGYDIRNKHYWASAAFTGIHGYAMAGIWMLFGLTFGSYLIIKSFHGGFHPFINHPNSYFLACFALIAIFASIAIIFSSLIVVANQTSLHRSKNLMNTILGAANSMKQTIESVTQGLIKIQTLLRPYDVETYDLLDHITNQMQKETISIQNFVKEARQASNHAIKAVYIANLVLVTANFVVLVAGCVVVFLHWHPGFIIVIIVCWILTTVSWILTGFDFFFHIFGGDTCSAFENFERNQNPESNSIMSILSSCSNSSNSDKFMAQIGYTVHKYISESNSEITTLAHKMIQPNEEGDDSFAMERICDPFSTAPNYNYAPGDCPQDSIQIHDLPNILSTLTCEKNIPTKICKAQGRFFPESSYGKTMAYIQSIENLIATYPDLQNLTECTPIRVAISDVALRQCKPFKTSIRLLWVCVLSLSIDLMILTSLLIVKAYQEKGKELSLCSIVPSRHSC
ncbi:uncharacterized protein LOC111906421 isoform X1 [Lactuca sativa]|uniref:Uncharacterized protein n=2 Tax=Lactuca sativa TaxID=4236 RepID=A0A9R1VUH5_LACSA|nr:uncharacterized protein LOC111906421 isoform X1 [Lactuca sativa]KAJ0210788.1 hypothetical protein LSAT_V11C400219190 [Lactuca sativa]